MVDEKVATLGMTMVAGQKKGMFFKDFPRKRAALDTDYTATVVE